MTSTDSESPSVGRGDARRWFLRGALTAFSIPSLVLYSAFVGFAGLAREAGLTVYETVFMVGVVWALPAKVVLTGAIISKASLLAAAFAVALSSVRLMPMVVALVPEMRAAGTRRWVLYLLSHFVAVTSWVLALERFPRVPRPMRTSYYAGMGSSLLVVSVAVVVIVFGVAGALPPIASAALLLLTPVYFLNSLWGSARERASHVSMVLGLALGPVCHVLLPGFDLLAAGLIGGGAAYAWHRLAGRRQTP